jgi:WD40 repeat protein
MPLNRYRFLLTAILGLGMIAPTDVATPYAQLDGAAYERTVYAPRDVTLGGRIQATSAADLDRKRAALAAVLGRDTTGQQQPLTLLYQQYAGDRAASDVGRVLATYQSGLDGAFDSLHSEVVTPTFRLYVPFVLADREHGATLDVQDSITNANYIIRRTAAGSWQALGTGITGTIVNAILVARDGTVYVGGNFTDAGGSGADYIARYLPDSDTWSVVGSATALNGEVRALVEGPDGSIYASGAFTNAGGVAAADYIAKWSGSAWSALGTGANADGVYSLAFDGSGNLYAGGSFTLMGGVANTVRIAKWNGSAWSALGTGAAANSVKALAWSKDGYLYAGGSFFTGMGGVADTNGIARWNGTAWGSITADTLDVNALTIGPDNRVFIGDSSSDLLVYNGSGLAAVGGAGALSGAVQTLAFLPDGRLLVGQDGVTFGGNTVDDGLGAWNGASWEAAMVNLPGSQSAVYAVAAAPDGGIYAGYAVSGTATVPGRVTVTNDGAAKVYPTLTIKGPSSGTASVAGIENLTTHRRVRLVSSAAFLISAGETWTFDFDPASLSFVSDTQGNIASRIRPGSNEADFFLAPGDNVIAIYSSGSTVTATMHWRPRYEHLGGLTL